jgi:hypothetical protein
MCKIIMRVLASPFALLVFLSAVTGSCIPLHDSDAIDVTFRNETSGVITVTVNSDEFDVGPGNSQLFNEAKSVGVFDIRVVGEDGRLLFADDLTVAELEARGARIVIVDAGSDANSCCPRPLPE